MVLACDLWDRTFCLELRIAIIIVIYCRLQRSFVRFLISAFICSLVGWLAGSFVRSPRQYVNRCLYVLRFGVYEEELTLCLGDQDHLSPSDLVCGIWVENLVVESLLRPDCPCNRSVGALLPFARVAHADRCSFPSAETNRT